MITHESLNSDCLRRQVAVKNVVEKLIECLQVEGTNILESLKQMKTDLSLETQMALLAVSENYLGANEITQVFIQGVTSDKQNWMNDVGLQAIIKACQSNLITVKEVTSFDNLNLFNTETIAEKIAKCLNIHDDLFEVVSKNRLKLLKP
jgi:hypothetical protein